MWLFDVAWALTIFFGLRLLAARLLAVRIGLLAALVAGGIAAGLGVQRAVAEGNRRAALPAMPPSRLSRC